MRPAPIGTEGAIWRKTRLSAACLCLFAVAASGQQSPSPPVGKSGPAPIRDLATNNQLWPNGVIPYQYHISLHTKTDILRRSQMAIDAWNNHSGVIELRPRSGEDPFLLFRLHPEGSECSANVGRFNWLQRIIGEHQNKVNLSESCNNVDIVHEIGHAVSLFHEHQRTERDRFVNLKPARLEWTFKDLSLPKIRENKILTKTNYDNTFGDFHVNFRANKEPVKESPYDYTSVMHYGAGSFQTIPPGIPINVGGAKSNYYIDRGGLSPGDIDGVKRLYWKDNYVPVLVTITTNPPGLDIIVDDVRETTPHSVSPGTYTLEAPLVQHRGANRYLFGNWGGSGGNWGGAGWEATGNDAATITVNAGGKTTWFQANFIEQIWNDEDGYSMPWIDKPAIACAAGDDDCWKQDPLPRCTIEDQDCWIDSWYKNSAAAAIGNYDIKDDEGEYDNEDDEEDDESKIAEIADVIAAWNEIAAWPRAFTFVSTAGAGAPEAQSFWLTNLKDSSTFKLEASGRIEFLRRKGKNGVEVPLDPLANSLLPLEKNETVEIKIAPPHLLSLVSGLHQGNVRVCRELSLRPDPCLDIPVHFVVVPDESANGGMLTPGQPAHFRLGPVDNPTIFVGGSSYRLEVPANATRVTFSLQPNESVDMDMGLRVRFGEDNDVQDGRIVSDYSSETTSGNERIVITRSSDPPLRAGTYYASLVLWDTGVVAEGTLTATIETGGGGTTTDDHGDTPAEATALSPGSPAQGRIETGRDVDYFRLQTTAESNVEIYTSGSLDTTGSLHDSANNRIVENDDGGTGTNFRIARRLSAGVYYIAVRSYGSRTGSYTLHARVTDAPPPSNRTGGPLTPGQPAPFRLGPRDLDTTFTRTIYIGNNSFRLEVPANATGVTFTLNSANPDVNTDLFVRFGEDNDVQDGRIVSDYSSETTSGNERIVITRSSDPPLRSGTYYASLALSDKGIVAEGTLTAIIETGGGGTTTDDHGDTPAEATALSPGSPAQGRIETGRDVDYFRLQTTAESNVEIYTSGSLDTTGSLHDSANNRIVENDDGGTGLNFRIARRLSAGVYYIAVRSYGSRTGSYTLHARVTVTAPPPSNRAGGPLTPGQPAPFRLVPVDNPTIFPGGSSYRLEVPANATRVTFSLQPNESVDMGLRVRFGENIARGQDRRWIADYVSRDRSRNNERIVITRSSDPPLRAGTYYAALVLWDTGVVAEGTLTATIETGQSGQGMAPGEVFRDDCDSHTSVCPEMVVIPAGSFEMGSPENEEGREDDEGPQHEVTIPRAFAVGTHEVTVGEYAAFAVDTGYEGETGCWRWTGGEWQESQEISWRNPGYSQTGWHPVACVSWEDARAYARWLSRKTGEEYRLLSEAEWEYAARAGSRTRYSFGDRITPNDANYDRNIRKTQPVGSYEANWFGLYDMHGNVWERVQDCQNGSYRGAPSNGDAWERGNCSRRVLRGGSWLFNPRYLRSANRGWDGSGIRRNDVGFRVARTLTP